MKRFHIQQNEVMRFILNRGCDTPVAEMIESLDWLNGKRLPHFEIY